MKTKRSHGKNRGQIALEMLERYSGAKPRDFCSHILLTNFDYYFKSFLKKNPGSKVTYGSVIEAAHNKRNKISLINFRMGAPSAALVIDILSYVRPTAVLMLGMCGGLHPKVKIGEFILPMAAIRNEGTSQFYMPPQIPALPTFHIQKVISEVLTEMNVPYKTGVVHSTDYRFWEFDRRFKEKLRNERAIAIEMECSALFVAGFKMKTPIGALLLVSDIPLKSWGIKTNESARNVFRRYTNKHLEAGCRTLKAIQKMTAGIDIRHFEW